MSRNKYECYYCRDHGFPNTMVFLAGKDDSGKTIQLEEDGTRHIHKTAAAAAAAQTTTTATPQQQQGSTTVVSESTQLKIINAKLDQLIALIEEDKKGERAEAGASEATKSNR